MEKVGDQGPWWREKLSQWFFNISKFADDLQSELEELENWPNKVKIMQQTGLENLLL